MPDRERPIVVYCAAGTRSAFAAKTLEELGYDDVDSLAGGFTDWKRNGFPTRAAARRSTPEQRARYSRHLLIPEVGEAGQLKLLDSRILLIGAGGLGSPASLYLAAAGVGTLGIVDDDVVDASNLQRQIVHSTERLGDPKVESAKQTIEALNPDVEVKPFQERLTSENVDRILGEGWDVIVDGADNFPTRYLLNDASVWHRHPRRPRLDLPLRGPGDRLQARRGPVLPLPLPAAAAARARAELRRGRRARRAAGRSSARSRRTRRSSSRSGSATRSSAGCCSSTRSRRRSPRSRSAAIPPARSAASTPTITEYIDYVEFCAGPPGGRH